jgi:hypothetical protein
MADETPTSDPAVNDALASAREEFDALHISAADADSMEGAAQGVRVYTIENVGRYAAPIDDSWEALEEVLATPEYALGFAPHAFPGFDHLITSAHPLDMATLPTHGITALRNYLFTLYYDRTPEGMTAEQARQALEGISRFLAHGLYSVQMGRREVSGQPYLVPEKANAAGSAGPRYLYQRLHRQHRQIGWLRPLHAIAALFGGHAHADWRLPPVTETPFVDIPAEELTPALLSEGAELSAIDAALAYIGKLTEQQLVRDEQYHTSEAAHDLEALGEQLLHDAEHMQDITQISEPVRQDAIEIAREILRKLKVKLDKKRVIEGLSVQPQSDDVEELGGLKGVAKVYERLLAWGRGVDASIMQHPSILAATLALGKLGHAMKLEALKLAQLAGNVQQATLLKQSMGSAPKHFTELEEEEFAILLYRIEQGIDTVLNRVQEINGPGAAVGHSPAKELGSYMSGTPIAGGANQGRAEGVGNRDITGKQQAAAQQQQANASRAQMQRVATQIAQQQGRGTGGANVSSAPSRGSANAQLNAMRQRLSSMRRNAVSQQVNAAQRANANRQGQIASHAHDDHHDDHHPQPQVAQPPAPIAATMAKLDPRLINNIKAMNTTTAGLTTNPVTTGRAAFDKMQQANMQGLKGAPPPKKPTTEEEKKKQQQQMNPPPPPKDRGGRGY